MKIGVIYTAYNMEDYAKKSLPVWLQKYDFAEFVICGVSVPFEKFAAPRKDNTLAFLKSQNIKVIESETPIKETEARTRALNFLAKEGVDYFWQVDADEFYTSEQIGKIVAFIRNFSDISWFRLSLKNYVFDEKTYLIEPFTPPRIHKRRTMEFVAEEFWDDNNITYGSKDWALRDVELSGVTVPKKIAWIKHLTWLNDDRSREKIAYQESRGWKCSYKWENGLVWNGVPQPTATE